MRIVCISFGFIEYTIQLANALSKSEDVLLLLPEKLADKTMAVYNECKNMKI